MTGPLKYRPDIDGLRAVAVLSVIVFHINQDWLPGGFVGVDIFFVISGYLISLHIFQEIDGEGFSLLEFYRRRIKRIAPAMLLVVAVTLIASQLLLRPEDAESVARSGGWALFSLANVYFWKFQDIGYFAAASNELPLLHLWSLGVEEQFYIFWPVALMIFYRSGPRLAFVAGLSLLAAISFVFGQFYFAIDPSFVYYMLPARAGELLVGAIVAQVVLWRPEVRFSESLLKGMYLLGAVLIAASLVMLSEDGVFPGFRSLPPTIGTALLIVSGNFGSSGPKRILMSAPAIWIGVISYSAYLWHWPILALLRYGQYEIGALIGAAVVLLTFLLAWATYKYIEQPFRRTRAPFTRVATTQYLLPAFAIGMIAVVSLKTDGYGFRWLTPNYESRLAAVRDATKGAFEFDYVCQKQRIEKVDLSDPRCVLGFDDMRPPTAILWGDSNAAHYVGMLNEFAIESGFSFRNIQVGACPPLAADPSSFVTSGRLYDCKYSADVIWPLLSNYRTILISAAWTTYQQRDSVFLQVFEDTVNRLVENGHQVVIIGKAPIIHGYDRKCREKAISMPFLDCTQVPAPLDENVDSMNRRLKSIARNTDGLEYFDANAYLCPSGVCSVFERSGEPIFADRSHLTIDASHKLGKRIIGEAGVPRVFRLDAN